MSWSWGTRVPSRESGAQGKRGAPVADPADPLLSSASPFRAIVERGADDASPAAHDLDKEHPMVSTTNAFSSFSVNDVDAARAFYADVVGIEVDQTPMGLDLRLGSGGHVFVYPKKNHVAASFTVLNFGVDDVDAAVDDSPPRAWSSSATSVSTRTPRASRAARRDRRSPGSRTRRATSSRS